jgi:TPR repeat protein
MFSTMSHFLNRKSSGVAPEFGLSPLESKAAEGDAEAQFNLGLGFGCVGNADYIHAAHWYRRAAEQNHALAQYNLGVMFARGQGVSPDNSACAVLMRQAAEGGDAGGQYYIGAQCHRASADCMGQEATESRIEAYKWYHLARAQGYRDADIACQRVTLAMSRDEIVEGDRRTAAFIIRTPASPQGQ